MKNKSIPGETPDVGTYGAVPELGEGSANKNPAGTDRRRVLGKKKLLRSPGGQAARRPAQQHIPPCEEIAQNGDAEIRPQQ